MPTLAEIIVLLKLAWELEQKLEKIYGAIRERIEKVGDENKRKRLLEAFDKRDVEALKKILYENQ